MAREPQDFVNPTQFVDGVLIPYGYLDQVREMINMVCDIEAELPLWELKLYARERRHAVV